MAISSDANMTSLSNINDTERGSDVKMMALIATLICLLAGVLCVQLWTPE